MKSEAEKITEQLRCAEECQNTIRRNLYWHKVYLSMLESFGRWLTRYEAGEGATLTGLQRRSKAYRRRLARETQRGLQLGVCSWTRQVGRMRACLRTNG